jgi:hypothetical protein
MNDDPRCRLCRNLELEGEAALGQWRIVSDLYGTMHWCDEFRPFRAHVFWLLGEPRPALAGYHMADLRP